MRLRQSFTTVLGNAPWCAMVVATTEVDGAIDGDCSGCTLRAQCTNSKTVRTLKRYDGEEIKEAMAAVLNQPAARRQLRRRGAITEPLFADLRERQRLTRFHRHGLKWVKVEFALHCAAYNLHQAAAGAAGVLYFTIFIRSIPGRRLVAASSIIFSFRLQ